MTALSPDDDHLVYVPLRELATPPSGIIEHRAGYWWAVHPIRGAIFFRRRPGDTPAPQCNADERITRRFLTGLYPWAECVQVPHAFRKVNPRGYY